MSGSPLYWLASAPCMSRVQDLPEDGDTVTFTAHLDSAFTYNPIGTVLPYLIDVKGAATRNPCP
jgi:hypothetical protein